jgi:hypothetical protein
VSVQGQNVTIIFNLTPAALMPWQEYKSMDVAFEAG